MGNEALHSCLLHKEPTFIYLVEAFVPDQDLIDNPWETVLSIRLGHLSNHAKAKSAMTHVLVSSAKMIGNEQFK